MGVVVIECPNTGRVVSTGIETDADSFRSLPHTLSRFKCPLCGGVHHWWKGEAWLADGPDLALGVVHRVKTSKAAR